MRKVFVFAVVFMLLSMMISGCINVNTKDGVSEPTNAPNASGIESEVDTDDTADTGNDLNTQTPAANNVAQNNSSTENAGNASISGSQNKLQEMVVSLKAEAEEQKKNVAGSLDISVELHGEQIIYQYKYLIDVEEPSLMKAVLEMNVEDQKDKHMSVIDDLRAGGEKSASLMVRYLDKNNNELYSREFK